ncbi:MAG: hypothetical protein RL736_335 [Pseudomonadota bacterium]|jgi:hypothetical protein
MKFIVTILISFFLLINPTVSQDKKVDDHIHKSIEAKSPFPSVDIKITKDISSGYNLQLITKNFKFTPEKIGTANVMSEGHAHIYINGKKTRLYSEWYHIDDEKLTQPINQIRVTLNANDHSEYTVNSRPVEAIGAIKNEGGGNWYNNNKK